MKQKNFLFIFLTLAIVLLVTCCTNETKHKTKQSEEVLSEFFLGIPVKCDYSQAEKYVEKLYTDSIIGAFKSTDGSRQEVISKHGPAPNTVRILKMIGVDSITSGFSIWADLMLENDGKVESHHVVTDLYFYNSKLAVVHIRPSAFSVIKMKSLLETYEKKYGEPEYIDKEIKGKYGKYDISGISGSFLKKDPYIHWEENPYIVETLWSFKNASIKLVNFHCRTAEVVVSEYSYEKAEDYYGVKYGKWDEQYLNNFLSKCTILKKEYNDKNEIGVFYINKDVVSEIDKDVKRQYDEIQNIKLQKQKEKDLKDSMINEENKKKYDKQKI